MSAVKGLGQKLKQGLGKGGGAAKGAAAKAGGDAQKVAAAGVSAASKENVDLIDDEDREPTKGFFGFLEYKSPKRMPDPEVNDEYAGYLAENAPTFFNHGLQDDTLGHIFYEDCEMDALKATYGKIFKKGDQYFDALDEFSRCTSRNDARIAIFFPLSLMLLVAAVSMVVAVLSLTDWVSAPLVKDPMFTYGVSGGTALLAVLFYLYVRQVPYTNRQRLSLAHFDVYASRECNFTEIQFAQLMRNFQAIENRFRKEEAAKKGVETASQTAVALYWSVISSLLFQYSIRNVLFRYRRNAAWWRFIGGGLILIVGASLMLLTYMLHTPFGLIESTPWGHIGVQGGCIALMFAVQQFINKGFEFRAERNLKFADWRLFAQVNFIDNIREWGGTEKRKIVNLTYKYADMEG
ncbi:MAG: hypothetical protein AAF585_19040 [Verrucomicrobiota bacterium]